MVKEQEFGQTKIKLQNVSVYNNMSLPNRSQLILANFVDIQPPSITCPADYIVPLDDDNNFALVTNIKHPIVAGIQSKQKIY